MTKLISTSAIAIIALGLPSLASAQTSYYNSNGGYAHQACKNKEDNRQILGGVAGAVVGGVLGSQVSGRGARTEGSAIGAVLGGLAGAGVADKTIDCDPVYPGQTYSQYPTSSQPVYQDRVTYSNHPVYTQPQYGAGAISYGTTYTTGTTSYPPYTSQPVYREVPRATRQYQTQTISYPATTTYRTTQTSYPSYQSSYPQTYHRTTYTPPRPIGFHYHGSYGCSSTH